MPKPLKYTEEEIRFITDNYGKMSYKDMAQVLGRSHGAIKRAALTKCDLTIVGRGKNKFSRSTPTFTCNENYFAESSDEVDYWAGFIAADGCILDKRGNGALQIMLSSKDESHLANFVKSIGFNGAILRGTSKYTYNGVTTDRPMVVVRINCPKLCADLSSRYGITPRKTKTFRMPENYSFNFWAFLQGYIDGDGCIEKYYLGQKWGSRLSLLGTPEFIRQVTQELRDKANITKWSISKRKSVDDLVLTNLESRRLLRILSALNTPRLERKWEGIYDACRTYKDPRIKLKEVDLLVIRYRLLMGDKQKAIAEDYGVHQVTISQINLFKHTLQKRYQA